MALSKSVNLEHAQTAVPCNVCEDETPGEYYCIECKHTLCPPCEKYHRKFTKGHNVVLRTQVGDIDTTILTCTDHGDQASFHCEKCNVQVCGKCITGNHRGHEMSDLDDLFYREKKVMQHDITRMEEILRKFKKERDEVITEKEKYDSKIQQTTTDLETEIKAAHEELDRIHNKRMENLASIREHQLSICDGRIEEIKNKIDILENRITEYKKTVRRNSLPAIIHISRRKELVPAISRKAEIPELPFFVPGSLHKLEENLGTLQVSSSAKSKIMRGKPLELAPLIIVSKFKSPLKGWSSICINKKGDVWLGGYESRELVMVDIKGQVLRRRNIQNRPFALALMDCGDVIISPRNDDSRSVTRLLRDDTEQHVYDTSPYCSHGVSVTDDQKILICIQDGEVVRMDDDDTKVKQIYRGSGSNSALHAVENADGNIHICDYRNHVVVKVSSAEEVSTKTTHTIGEGKLERPYGLAVDKIGNIVCADIDNDIVYIINKDMQLRALVESSFGHQRPRFCALDNTNNLWITHNDGTVLVVKYFT